MPTLYHHIYGFSMFNTLTKALHVIVNILQIISSFFVFNKPLEIPSYIPLFSQCGLLVLWALARNEAVGCLWEVDVVVSRIQISTSSAHCSSPSVHSSLCRSLARFLLISVGSFPRVMGSLLKRGVTGTPIVKVFMYTHGIYNTLGEYCSTWGVVEHHKCHFTPQ